MTGPGLAVAGLAVAIVGLLIARCADSRWWQRPTARLASLRNFGRNLAVIAALGVAMYVLWLKGGRSA